MRLVTRPSKLELIDINGTEDHLRQVTQIVENITSTVDYVYLKFANYEDGRDPNCTDALARQYMELFKDQQAFKNVRTLKIDIFGNGNFATMFDEMNKQKAHIAMFNTVETLKIYECMKLTEKDSYKTFLLNF